MATAKDLFARVQAAQRQLGTGEVEEALAVAPGLRQQAMNLLAKGGLLTSFDRTYATAAYTYASVTLILGLADARLPAEFVPRIRDLVVDACRRHRPGSEIWKVPASAAEMLARAGDADGACWAIKRALVLSPKEDELVKLAGGIRSMYPGIYAQTPNEPPEEPPPLPEPGK